MASSADRYWMGTSPSKMKCDSCGKVFTDAFSDIRTIEGSWGVFCDNCVGDHAAGHPHMYGQGLGQRYAVQPDGQWRKTHG